MDVLDNMKDSFPSWIIESSVWLHRTCVSVFGDIRMLVIGVNWASVVFVMYDFETVKIWVDLEREKLCPE